MKHIFAISAYGQSPYLEDCILSLERQSLPGEILICTSTPSDYLTRMAKQHRLPLYVREGTPSLQEDWNFCVETAAEAGAQLLTIAHQDDVYLPDYAGKILAEASPRTSLLFTAAENIDARGRMVDGGAEKIKRILRLPLRIGLGRTGFGRRLCLAFGNSIPCPACTYNLNYVNHGEKLFAGGYRFVTDWNCLFALAEKKGGFVYIPEPGVRIRLHEGQETRRTMEDGTRCREELEMLRRCHTEPAAKALMHFYSKAGDISRSASGNAVK